MTQSQRFAFGSLAAVQPDASARGVLNGVRVLDMSRLVAGNMLTLQLVDFGADVIKIESSKAGATLRHWHAMLDAKAPSAAWWRMYARKKRSLALALRDVGARDVLRTLLQSAQVVVESFRPGTLGAMGFDAATLEAL